MTLQDKMDSQEMREAAQEIRAEAAEAAATDNASILGRLRDPRTILSFLVALGLIAFLIWRTEIDFGAIVANILRANPAWLLAAFVIYYLTFPLRGLRWRMLLQNVGVQKEPGVRLPGILSLSEIIYLGWWANTLVPAKLGDGYRAYLLKRWSNVSFSTSLGTILAERAIDMLVLFGLLLTASMAFLVAGPPNPEAGNLELLIIGAGALMSVAIIVGLFVFWRAGGRIERRLPERFRGRFAALHMGVILSFRRLPLLGSITVVIWFMEAIRLYFTGLALGYQLELPVVIFVALAGSILTTIPFTPGGLAVVEGGTVGLLVILTGLSGTDAASIIILDRVISYWSLLMGGTLLFFITKKK